MRPKRVPIRTCVGCGAREAQARLIRLQLDTVADLLPGPPPYSGRSAYLHPAAQCVDGLVKSRSLGRSLRRDVSRETRQRCVQRVQKTLVACENVRVEIRAQHS